MQRLKGMATLPQDRNDVGGHAREHAKRHQMHGRRSGRAIAVVKFLHSQGIPNERLVAAGYGEYQPLSAIDSARNRRIELKLTSR